MTLADLLTALLGPLGLSVACLLIIYGSYREWWVPGVTFRRALGRIDTLEAEKAKVMQDKDRIAEVALTNSISTKIMAELERERAANAGGPV